MKILLFGMTRSRSSYLADCIAKHYNLDHYFEPYHETSNMRERFNREIYVDMDKKKMLHTKNFGPNTLKNVIE